MVYFPKVHSQIYSSQLILSTLVNGIIYTVAQYGIQLSLKSKILMSSPKVKVNSMKHSTKLHSFLG